MKVLTMVTTTNPDKAGPPPPALFQAINELGAVSAGLKDTGGMKDTGKVKVQGGQLLVDGPYTEAKEAIGGYAIYELPTQADVFDYCKKFLELHRKHWPTWEGEVSVLELINPGAPPAK
jgi:hypothetical protein